MADTLLITAEEIVDVIYVVSILVYLGVALIYAKDYYQKNKPKKKKGETSTEIKEEKETKKR